MANFAIIIYYLPCIFSCLDRFLKAAEHIEIDILCASECLEREFLDKVMGGVTFIAGQFCMV
jgi:hypothetical protein